MNTLDVIGLSLWWAEGTKLRLDKRWKNTFIYAVEITNTNPQIISIFLKYLRSRHNVQNEKIKLQLQLHEGDDQQELEDFWENETLIPKKQFDKTIIRPLGNKPGKSKGTCKIRIYDKSLHLKLIDSLKQLQDRISDIKNIGV